MLTQVVSITCHCVGRSRVRFPMVSLDFFIDIILPRSTEPLTEERTRNISLGVKAAVA